MLLHPCPPHVSLLIPSDDQTYYEQDITVGTEKTEGHRPSLLGRRITDNRNALLTWLLFHTVLQKWIHSPWGHISPPPRPFHDPTPVTHSKVFWDIDSCFLGNCHSDQGQSIRLLPLLSPGISIFGRRKVDRWQFPSFTEVFTHVLFLCCFYWQSRVGKGSPQTSYSAIFKAILAFSSYANRSRDIVRAKTVPCQFLIPWPQLNAGQWSLGRGAPWLDALMITGGRKWCVGRWMSPGTSQSHC